MKPSHRIFPISGFTLAEVLVVSLILSVLLAFVVPVGLQCMANARMAREMNGARRAVEAWRSYASDNNQSVLPGYQMDASARNARGQRVTFPANARYVFRLAPYLEYALKGTLHVNQQAKVNSDYDVSMAPSFGINLTFVGGDYGGGTDLLPSDENYATYGKFVVTNLNEIHSPARLLVFASARVTDSQSRTTPGYNAIRSPRWTTSRWPSVYSENLPYYEFGAVHPRYADRAVCAMADGHVELLTMDELRDMRRWSNQAAQADDPDWTLQPL